jgi:hypothetical protein
MIVDTSITYKIILELHNYLITYVFPLTFICSPSKENFLLSNSLKNFINLLTSSGVYHCGVGIWFFLGNSQVWILKIFIKKSLKFGYFIFKRFKVKDIKNPNKGGYEMGHGLEYVIN